MWEDNLTTNLVDPLCCSKLLRCHVDISHNHTWKVHGVYERSQTREFREIGRTNALRVREVTSNNKMREWHPCTFAAAKSVGS